MSIAAAVLAAGASRRLGRPKQLVELAGEPLVRRAARAACAAADAAAVVLGAHAGSVAAALAGLPIAQLTNLAWPDGMASSICCAVAWAARNGHDALVICACDQPRLTASHLRVLLAAHRRSGRAAGSCYAGVVGVPAVFPARDYPALGRIAGDHGARALLAGADAVDWPDGTFDVDLPSDLSSCSQP